MSQTGSGCGMIIKAEIESVWAHPREPLTIFRLLFRTIELFYIPKSMTDLNKIKQSIVILWNEPRSGITLHELNGTLKKLGHEILEIDRKNNRIKVKHNTK